MMRQLAAQGFEGKLTADECQEVVDFVAEFSATRELSLRLLEPSFGKSFTHGKQGWTGGSLSPASSTRSVGLPLPKVSDSRELRLGVPEAGRRRLSRQRCRAGDGLPHPDPAFSRATFFRLKKMLGKIGKPATAQAAMGIGRLYGKSTGYIRHQRAGSKGELRWKSTACPNSSGSSRNPRRSPKWRTSASPAPSSG